MLTICPAHHRATAKPCWHGAEVEAFTKGFGVFVSIQANLGYVYLTPTSFFIWIRVKDP